MKALDGPFEGKEYRDVPDETKQIIDHYRDWYVTSEMLKDPNYHPIHKVVYNRTDKGWVEEK